MYKNPLYVYGPKEVEVPMSLNFGEHIVDKMWKYRDNVACINVETKESLTYGEMLQQTMSFAVSLTRMGVKRHDVVGIISENRNDFWVAVFGVTCTGAVVTTFSNSYEAGELKHTLNISKPKYIILSPTMYKKHEKTLRSINFIQKIIVFGSEKFPNAILFNDFLNIDVKYEDFVCADVDGQTDTLFIIYSSGTTGLPKGVMLTHLNVLIVCCLPVYIDPSEKTLSISPWYHTMGLVGSITAFCYGRTSLYLAKFNVDTYLKAIETYKVSQLAVVPPVLVAVCKYPNKYDLSSVKMIFSGAAPLHKETVIAVHKKFPNLQAVMQGYGASETTLAVTRVPADPQIANQKMGSIGTLNYGIQAVKVVDIETRKPLGPNQQGEICVKGPIIMKGYIGKNRSDDFDSEGFYKTGDVGYYDNDGFFYIADRLKELIKYKGYQVPPAELEDVLLTHPDVKDVGVIGVPDKSSGEVPMAFIVLLPGKNTGEQEFKTYVAERSYVCYCHEPSHELTDELNQLVTTMGVTLSKHGKLSNPKHLRGGVRFIDQIPKSVSGKILRKDLKKMVKIGKSKL